jgi:hypothetical protein
MAFNVEDIFYKVASGITGGLVNDFGTAIFGGIVLLLILAGLDILKEFFEISMSNLFGQKHFSAAHRYLGMRDASGAGSMEYDYYNALYKSHLNKSVSLSSKTGKTFSVDESIEHGIGTGFNPLYQNDDDISERDEIELGDFEFIGNDVFFGADTGSDEEFDIEFDQELDPPGLYQRHIRKKYF